MNHRSARHWCAATVIWAACAAFGQESGPASRTATVSAESLPTTRPTDAIAIEDALRRRLAQPMSTLDLDLVMFGPEFFGEHPVVQRWTDDSRSVLFTWREPTRRDKATYSADATLGTFTRLAPSDPGPRSGVRSPDGLRRLVVKKNALVIEDVDGAHPTTLVRLSRPPSRPSFDAKGDGAYFEVDNTLVHVSFTKPEVRALLTWSDGERPAEKVSTESAPADRAKRLAEQMEKEQVGLFRRLFEREEAKRAETRPDSRPDDEEPARYVAPPGFSVEDVQPSPSGEFAVIRISKGPRRGGRSEQMPDYVTKSGYTEPRAVRAKAGDAEADSRLVIVRAESGKGVDVADPECGSPTRVSRTAWSRDGAWLVGQAQSRDRSHAFLVRIEPATGAITTLHRHDDPAWVLGQDSWGGFVGGTETFWFLSETNGWLNLFLVDVRSGTKRALDPGAYEVSDVEVAPDGESLIATASVNSPASREIVRFDVRTGRREVLTRDGGLRTVDLSPNGAFVAEVWSKPNRPPELRIREITPSGVASPRTVTRSPSVAFESWPFIEPPIERIPTDGGVEIPARVFRPKAGSASKAGVVFVHGAGYLQNVHDGWSHYEREYAFHQHLAGRGYTVVDIDYRGSAGYGRAFRAAVKGGVGEVDTRDCVAAAAWLVEHEGCERERIGLYGGSYGGFLTLMALFRHPGVFHAGAALRPVTDWAHYHEGYTSNLLDDPLDQEATYRRASPISWAGGLQDHLLICHGLVDDNVFAQDSIRLVQRLIELRKKNFELALYPTESHGFTDAASWTDEYRRIESLFDRTLLGSAPVR